ncbi:MAG: hypothetical protein JW829_13395 [Pirellulales bacterium]|nr:hypothetical protein [Pirellulales bacterium]
MYTPRALWIGLLLLGFYTATSGCNRPASSSGRLEAVWGRRGISPGRLQKPRAMAIDAKDHIYIVDITSRIQVFDMDGNYLRGWKTPACENGRPTGLTMSQSGQLLVADSHYFRILFYTTEGILLDEKTIGGTMGQGPGEFSLVADVVQDSKGNYYIAEYGENDRIQKISSDRKYLLQWGSHGNEPGQFQRPQNLAIDEQDRIWVADACNHRIQVFDTDGEFLFLWGQRGAAPGQLYYPYDLVLDDQNHVYVCEYGNHRIQKFTRDGKSLGCWGSSGRAEGELFNPWALVLDSRGSIHVLDTNNHRVQRVKM